MSDNLKIVPVRNSRQQKDFLGLRKRLYRDDPRAVNPLGSMDRKLIDPDQHPFYQHASRQLFVAYRNDRPVGRIAAIKDDLQQQYDQNQLGFFGFFECEDIPGLPRLLLDTAEQWLRENGCDSMRGPVNPSMKGEFGVLVEGHETPPSVMTIHNHAVYRDYLLAEGFEPIREFYAFRFQSKNSEELNHRWEKLFQARRRIMKRFPQLSFRAVDATSFESTMKEINEVSNRVRSAGWGYVPLTEQELNFMIQNLKRIIRYDMISVAYWEDQLVGYIVTIPDVNWALKRAVGPDWLRMLQMPFLIPRIPRARVIALGVDENFRTKGIAMLLIARLLDIYDTFEEWEFSWVDSENQKSIGIIERTLPLVRTKTYQLFQRPIN